MPSQQSRALDKHTRRRARAERANIAVEMDEARLAEALTVEEQALRLLHDLKASRQGAREYVKRLSSELGLARQVAKSAARERRAAERDLTASRLEAQKRNAKLAPPAAAKHAGDASGARPTEPAAGAGPPAPAPPAAAAPKARAVAG